MLLGLVGLGWIAGALFFLVLGGTMLPRALRAPLVLDGAFCVAILFAAWAAELDWYLAIWWLDVVVHAVVTGLVAALAHVALIRVGALPAVDVSGLSGRRLGAAVVTTSLGMALATAWEFGEWLGHARLDARIQVGYTDTMGDLLAGTVGALVAAVLLARGVLLRGDPR
jgi:hypothetical protein